MGHAPRRRAADATALLAGAATPDTSLTSHNELVTYVARCDVA